MKLWRSYKGLHQLENAANQDGHLPKNQQDAGKVQNQVQSRPTENANRHLDQVGPNDGPEVQDLVKAKKVGALERLRLSDLWFLQDWG